MPDNAGYDVLPGKPSVLTTSTADDPTDYAPQVGKDTNDEDTPF